MGMFDFLKRKPDEKKEDVVPKEEKTEAVSESPDVCSACNQPGADKTFGGLRWHKKCLRKTRKMAKGMV